MSNAKDGTKTVSVGCFSCGITLVLLGLFIGLAWRAFKWAAGI